MGPDKTVFSSAILIQLVQFQVIGASSLSSPPTLVTVGCNMGTHYVALHYERAAKMSTCCLEVSHAPLKYGLQVMSMGMLNPS